MKRLGIGLYGNNGHQIGDILATLPQVRLIGICGYEPGQKEAEIVVFPDLTTMLEHPEIDFVSVCSPRREDQARDIMQILTAGKHVLGEKPLAMNRHELKEIMELAQRKNLHCIEMAETQFEAPYAQVSALVSRGEIGQVVQIFAQKSYPMATWRPQEEGIDGGLILQNAIYCLRFVEQVAGQKVISISALETGFGNPLPEGELKMACTLQMELASGGLATAIANYLNPTTTQVWGNEELRIFGTEGLVQTNPFSGEIQLWNKAGSFSYQPENQERLIPKILQAVATGEPLPVDGLALVEPTHLAILAKASALEAGVKQFVDREN